MNDTFGKLIIIVCKQKDEPIYSMLKQSLKESCDILNYNELPDLNTISKQLVGKQTLIIFDDFVYYWETRKIRRLCYTS